MQSGNSGRIIIGGNQHIGVMEKFDAQTLSDAYFKEITKDEASAVDE